MRQPFPDMYKAIADSMGIALYQRFTSNEASLFLRCPASEVEQLQQEGKLNFIKVTETESQFFGYQLLEYILKNVTNFGVPSVALDTMPDRIVRAKDVVEMIGAVSHNDLAYGEKRRVSESRESGCGECWLAI